VLTFVQILVWINGAGRSSCKGRAAGLFYSLHAPTLGLGFGAGLLERLEQSRNVFCGEKNEESDENVLFPVLVLITFIPGFHLNLVGSLGDVQELHYLVGARKFNLRQAWPGFLAALVRPDADFPDQPNERS
jgi:hypothetical protein